MTPLFDAVNRHARKGQASFHTPGHKGCAGLLKPIQLLAHDLTELPDTASLYDGNDAIEEAERLAAKAFDTQLTLFSAGGCTLCIQTMLLLAVGRGGRVVMARNSHRSAVNAAALLGIDPVWAWPTGENGQITPADIEHALSDEAASGSVAAVYITSPDYYGSLADIPAISALCKAHAIPLLVDNAHGSHLGAFGLHPLTLGASMTADSWHKTMPVLTGGAVLHIAKTCELPIARQTAKAAMALFGSTSPAFPVLTSLDLARDWWSRAGEEAFRQTAAAASSLMQTAKELPLCVLTGEGQDPCRLTLDTAASGIHGQDAATFFRERGCEPEYADARFVVFILTPFNTPKEIERLRAALKQLPANQRRGRFLRPRPFSQPAAPETGSAARVRPFKVMTPREALLSPWESVPAHTAAGRIAARAVCVCPPGVAAVVPGERLDEQTAAQLEDKGFSLLDVIKK